MYTLKAFLFVLLVASGRAQDANCDFSQVVQVGRTYTISSPRYPSSYPAGVTCRWVAVCPPGYNCRVDFTEINLPSSQNCAVDRLLVSRSGDASLTAAEFYCGRGTLTAVSTGQRIAIGLTSSSSTPGGRFTATLTAIQDNTSQCSCGYKKRNRIVGGQETKPNEYPMMAGIIYREQAMIRCGGTIISPTYVVTAAHCVANIAVSNLGVVVGEHDVTTGNESAATQGFRVLSVRIHPQYNPSNLDYDVAIITVDGTIRFSEAVGPVCLPFKYVNNDFAGATVTLLGWGTIFFGGPTSDVLMKVDVNVVSQSSCQAQVPALTPRQMCTYTAGKDSCQDDSGGPVLYTDPSKGLLFLSGIISYGQTCAGRTPGVNTRTTTVLDWIVANAPYNYCRQ